MFASTAPSLCCCVPAGVRAIFFSSLNLTATFRVKAFLLVHGCLHFPRIHVGEYVYGPSFCNDVKLKVFDILARPY